MDCSGRRTRNEEWGSRGKENTYSKERKEGKAGEEEAIKHGSLAVMVVMVVVVDMVINEPMMGTTTRQDKPLAFR